MESKLDRNVSKLSRYRGIINNGLFLYGLRNRFANIGIDIDPYYWVQEEIEPCDEPIVKGGTSGFFLKDLTLKDQAKKLGVKTGQLCFALEYNGELAAYTFIELNNFEIKGRSFKLKPNEAYLLNMWTFHAYRGRNLAPYLRYKTYELLKLQGIDTKYSMTDYLNKSSIKFKQKLNSKNLVLYLNIQLFKKYNWNYTLKKY